MLTINEYDPREIAHTIAGFTECPVDEGARLEQDLTDALAHIQAIADNKYNQDYWRALWNALQNMAARA